MTASDERTCVIGEHDDITVCVAEDHLPAYRLLIDGQPPAVGRVIVERDRLAGAIEASGPGTLRMVVGSQRVTVSPEGAAEGVRLAAVGSGEPVTMGFSSGLLRTVLGALVGSQVMLHYAAANLPVRVSSPEHRDFMALVMPCRLEP